MKWKYNIPNRKITWEHRKLADVTIKIGSGKTPKGGSTVYTSTGVPFLRSQNINNDSVNFNEIVFIPEIIHNEMKNSFVFQNDILLNITGASIGRSAVYTHRSPANVNQHVCIIRPLKSINSYFIHLNLTSNRGQKQIHNHQAGGGREGLNFSQISEMSFDFPSIYEQNIISKMFSNIDKVIALHQRKIQLYLKLQEHLSKRLFLTDNNNIPKLRIDGFDKEWHQYKLKDLGYSFTGLSGKNKHDFGRGEGSFITYKNVFDNIFADYNELGKTPIDNKQDKVKYGDILFTTSSETPLDVGMSSIWLYNKDNVYLNSFCFGYRLTKNLDLYFLGFYLRSTTFRKQIIQLAQGISRYNISKIKALEISITIPHLLEQRFLGELLVTSNKMIQLNQNKIDNLIVIKKLYLNKLFL